ncbi:MAG: RluA family pseudouridine synthase [Capnocytophaga sp.]|nr:RluA family pseudouridine synthase [Capnocytophaga sp.]
MKTTKDNLQIIYEDNHIIVINKRAGDIVQGDKTGDKPLSEIVKSFLIEKYQKKGDAYLGVVHRLDRPTTGLVVFAKTSKVLPRLNSLFADKNNVKKRYLALVQKKDIPKKGTLTHWLTRNEKANKSKAHPNEVPNSKKAILEYSILKELDNYNLLEINLLTGRHHQIRSQLSALGCPIRGDIKYGAKRTNPDASISLHAYHLEFIHPVKKEKISLYAPIPELVKPANIILETK